MKNNDKIAGRWFEDYGFIISYGESDELIPLGNIVTYRNIELYNGSTDLEAFRNLSDEDKKKSMEVVFSNEEGDLVLRIPVDRLFDLRDIVEADAKPAEQIKDYMKLLGNFEKNGISLERLGGTVQIINENGDLTVLGKNYRLYPFELFKERIRVRDSIDDFKPRTKRYEEELEL